MKKILTLLAVFTVLTASAQSQKPKQHVFYDTVKSVQQRVDYSPDTIPVFFKEIIVDTLHFVDYDGKRKLAHNIAMEQLTPGFIIWQTYLKSFSGTLSSTGTYSNAANLYIGSSQQDYYTEPYKDNSISGKFLYLNKNPVTNKVIYAVKR